MALTGTLKDISLIALLQLPNSAKRTGLLTISGDEGEARLFYNGGNLVHAELGQLEGSEVLVSVVDWKDAEFKFEPGIESDDQTVTGDLHHTIMQALKTRDERRRLKAEEQQAENQESPEQSARLEDLLGENDSLMFACILKPGNGMVASAFANGSKDGVEDVSKLFLSFLDGYPQGPVETAIVVDSSGICGLRALDGQGYLLIGAEPGTRMGMLSILLGKMTEELGG